MVVSGDENPLKEEAFHIIQLLLFLNLFYKKVCER